MSDDDEFKAREATEAAAAASHKLTPLSEMIDRSDTHEALSSQEDGASDRRRQVEEGRARRTRVRSFASAAQERLDALAGQQQGLDEHLRVPEHARTPHACYSQLCGASAQGKVAETQRTHHQDTQQQQHGERVDTGALQSPILVARVTAAAAAETANQTPWSDLSWE